MFIGKAIDKLKGNGYQVLPIKGEPVYMVFWPIGTDGKDGRKLAALTEKEIIALADSFPAAGETRGKTEFDILQTGVVGTVVKVPATTSGERVPKIQIVLEIVGKHAVNSLPIDQLRDMLGEQVLLQMTFVQTRLNWEKPKETGANGAK